MENFSEIKKPLKRLKKKFPALLRNNFTVLLSLETKAFSMKWFEKDLICFSDGSNNHF